VWRSGRVSTTDPEDDPAMTMTTVVFLLFPALFVSILLFIEMGRRLGMRHVSTEADQTRAVFSRIETAIYGIQLDYADQALLDVLAGMK
jgi:hypothetical protein